MVFNGFPSISAYESECKRLGYCTKRIPYQRDGERCLLLITSPPNKTASSVEAWTLFDASETKVLLDGVISGGNMDPSCYMRNGSDVNYTGKLAASGYFPEGHLPPLQVLPLRPDPDQGQLSLF